MRISNANHPYTLLLHAAHYCLKMHRRAVRRKEWVDGADWFNAWRCFCRAISALHPAVRA